jgi:predicted ATP-binding protein involved in virulence
MLNHYEARIYHMNEILEKYNRMTLSANQLNQIMDLLPPPIFRTSFNLSYKNKGKGQTRKIPITDMSSGERQFLYSLSSVLYHLINLNSIDGNNRMKYNNIQIILEEIELYFHPEYQKKYIQAFIDRINLLQLNENMQIDVLIATHSPFILADIPVENILALEKGRKKTLPAERNTFCSNFYDLLKYEFFLEKNSIGLFAEKKISLIIKKIEEESQERLKDNLDILNKTIDLIGDPFLKGYIKDRLERKLRNV